MVVDAQVADAVDAFAGSFGRAKLLDDNERLSPDRVLQSIRAAGRKAEGFETADQIAEYLAQESRPGDLILVMSNGSFDGLCGKLLEKLQSHPAPAGKSHG